MRQIGGRETLKMEKGLIGIMSHNLPEWSIWRLLEELPRELKESPELKKKLRKEVERLIVEYGQEVARMALSHNHALERISGRRMEIRTIIDVGSSNGRWAINAKRYWPDAYCFCIEGFKYWKKQLVAQRKQRDDFDFVIAAAGDRLCEVFFLENSDKPTQGHAYDKNPDSRYRPVLQTTIDHEVAYNALEPPFLIKIDTHGREGEILTGAAETLKRTNLMMIEANNFEDRGRMRFHELCQFVEDRGFRCADIATPTFRKADNMFWQCDLVFIRKDRPEFKHRGFV